MFTPLSVSLIAPIEPYSPTSGSHAGDGLILHVRSLFELSGLSHLLTDNHSEADLIIVLEPCIIQDYRRYAKILTDHPCIRNFPEKCYTYNSVDRPWPILPGIYVSLDYTAATPWLHCGGPHLHFPNIHVNEKTACSVEDALQNGHLACFRGSPTSKLRVKLLKAAQNGLFPREIQIAKSFGAYFANGDEGQRSYCKEISEYAFSLAPAGFGPSTFRLYESMALGRPPVIIADSWMPPKDIPWSECSLIIPECDIANLHSILTNESGRCILMGSKARDIYEQNFSPHNVIKYIVRSIANLHTNHPYPRSKVWRIQNIMNAAQSAPSVPLVNQMIRAIRRIKFNLSS